MRTPHTHYPEGKRVLVILRDGTRFVAKFKRHDKNDGGWIYFLDHDPVHMRELRSMGYYCKALDMFRHGRRKKK